MKITIAPDYARYPVITITERIMLQHLADARYTHVTRFLRAKTEYKRAVCSRADDDTINGFLITCQSELEVIGEIDQMVIEFYWSHGGMFLS